MKKRLLAASAAVIFGVIVYIFQWASGPSTAVISTQAPEVKGVSTTSLAKKLVVYDMVSFWVSERYVGKNPVYSKGNPLYVQQLFSVPVTSTAQLFGDQLAVTVGRLPAGGLEEVSDVQLRRDRGDLVIAETSEQLLFEKSGATYETSAFITNKEDYFVVVLSGPSFQKEVLKQELSRLLATIVWR